MVRLNTFRAVILVAAILAGGWSAPGLAAGGTDEAGGGQEAAADHKAHDFHTHHVGVFAGYARKDSSKKKDGGKVGLEYEYQFVKWLGARAFVDYEGGDFDKWLVGGGAAFHVPETPIVLFVGGGAEIKDSKAEAFLRLAGEVKIKLTDSWSVAPAGGYDFADSGDGTWFVGVLLVKGF